MTFQRILIFCMLLLSPLLPAQAATAPISDAAALQGVKDGKGVFLIDFSDAKKTAFYHRRAQVPGRHGCTDQPARWLTERGA